MRPISVIALTLLAAFITGMLTYFSTSPTIPNLDLQSVQCPTSGKLIDVHSEIPTEVLQGTSKNDTELIIVNAKGEEGWNVTTIRLEIPLPFSVDESNFTIIILTYNRIDSLKQSLLHYGRFHNVRRILIIWNDITTNIPQELANSNYGAPVLFIKSKTNQLRNRFLQRKEIETQAVLHTDDDIRITEKDVEKAFAVWKKHSNLIIGSFTKRSDNRGSGNYFYMGPQKGYNMVLTGHAFIHARFHEIYQRLPSRVLQFIDDKQNCEDIALNYVASSLCECTGCLEVAPKDHIVHDIHVGLHTRPKHYDVRSECCSLFAQEFHLPNIKLRHDHA